ncbi:MAG TPA: hypothetical protein PLP49_10330 [Anaerohalosphaeraceae bacterium]|nr:hypothetical protein [Anaerohalosphaeraceae bacterium]HOM61813.1 hypothetical protein [Anaerohalosphaeraceae bacterium]HPB93863.1 hypothetical protein [Anaerohalosphaeraceae bacterium]HRT24359.1 hypothetical protein [Anaerohalosphaeraceae bacterium]
MAIPSDSFEVCNEALQYLGAAKITAASTAKQEYILCEQFLTPAIRETLAEYNWTEAIKRVYLVSAGIDIFGEKHTYQIPQDFIRLVSVGEEENTNNWTLEGQYILTDAGSTAPGYSQGMEYRSGQYLTYEDSLYSVLTAFTASGEFSNDVSYLSEVGSSDTPILPIRYVYYLSSPASWSVPLRSAVVLKLACKLSVPLANNPKVRYDLMQEYESIVMRKSRSIQSQQKQKRYSFYSSTWHSRYL